MLRERDPNLERLFEEAMRLERKRTEWKEQKVLQILQSKDRTIEDLQKNLTELEKNLAQTKVDNLQLLSKFTQVQDKLDQS
jgi:hypothetical protein